MKQAFVAGTLVLAGLVACATSATREGFGEGVDAGERSPAFEGTEGGGGGPGACRGLQCQIPQCNGGGTTTLTGKVVAPTPAQYGAPDPIYNAILYVPNADLAPFPEGVSCDKCGTVTSGEPIVTALSAADGTFTLEGVPAGKDIPLVIQVGRWRRRVTIPKVDPCTTTRLDLESTRLPRNKAEGDIPLMAIATSPYDPTECIMRKIGIDVAEFTVPTGGGRVHIYLGEGATLAGPVPPPSSDLWATTSNLQRYDLVAFPCQTGGTPEADGRENIKQYADGGGRIFVTDLSQDIIAKGPAGWPATATWNSSGNYTNPATIDTSFPKGQALSDWLGVIGATPAKGELNLEDTYVRLTNVNAPAQRWIYSANTVQTYSFNTPLTAAPADQCGRVVYSSFHIAIAGGDEFPSECTSDPLTPQEKVLEFLLFDLAACIQKDDTVPIPPPVVR